MPRQDPLRNFRFRVEIENMPPISFSEVEIGAVMIDVIEYREGGENTTVRKLVGLTRYGNVTLRRGVLCSGQATALELFAWISSVTTGNIVAARRTVTIVVLDDNGEDCARFVLKKAWPVQYVPSELEGQGRDVFIESIELVNEGIERQ
jgi:phage tail-like protein